MSASRPRIKVLVADDHPLFLNAAVEVVKRAPQLELVATASSGREALERIRELRPDAALLDIRMADLGGYEVLRALTREGLPTRVVLLSGHLGAEEAYEAAACGAAGLLSKTATPQEIQDAVVAAARGGAVVSPDLQRDLLDQIRVRAASSRVLLTPREQEVLRGLAEGLSAPDLAARLHVSTSTVKTHLQQLYEKLGVSDRAAAVAAGMRQGLIE